MKLSYFAVKSSSFHTTRGERHDDTVDRRNICGCHNRYRARGRVFANMTQVQDAGRAYQRLQEALAPLTDGKLAFTTAENEQRFHERCAEYLMQPEGNRPPLQQFLTATLSPKPPPPKPPASSRKTWRRWQQAHTQRPTSPRRMPL